MKNLLLILVISIALQVNGQDGYEVNEISNSNTLTSCMAVDDNENIWIGHARKAYITSLQSYGITRWDGVIVKEFNTSNSKLINNAVYDIVCEGDIVWVGTLAGLQRIENQGNKDEDWLHFDSLDEKGLGIPVISLKIIDNELWIGSDNGFGILNLPTQNFTFFSSMLWGKPKAQVWAFEKGENSDVWIGTDSGLVRKNGNNFTFFHSGNSGFTDNRINALYWDNDNDELWIGGNTKGLFRFKNNTIAAAVDINECFYNTPLESVHYFIKDKKYNTVLVGGSFNTYNRPAPSFVNLPSQKTQKYFIRANFGNGFISARNNGPLYAATDKNSNILLGLFNRRLVKITDLKKLPDDQENLGKVTDDKPKNLDVNQVNATILNRGDMFWDLINGSKYEVPKGSCKKSLLASSLWIGGIAPANSLHLAAMTYRQGGSDYYPGPLDTITGMGDTGSAYNRIWKISRWEIEELKQKYADGSLANGSYTPAADILQWPAHGTGNHSRQLAPFVDINNNGLYEPLQGDYPKIKGEQALYWIFNDNTDIHSETGAKPLGVEVHAMAYAYNCDTIKPGSPNEALNFTTFYEYKIINRSANRYEDSYLGVWSDVDLGNNSDDHVGCSPANNFAFVYNGDNNDEGPAGYGVNPPMLSIVFLSDTMTNFMTYGNDYSNIGNSTLARAYYGYMTSTWKDGTSLTYGGNGYNTGAPTNLAFPGIPYTPGEWNEANIGSTPGDRRFIQSTGRHTFEPGAVKTFSYAIVFSREPNQPNGLTTSWLKNMNDVNAVKNWHATQSFPSCLTKPQGLSAREPEINGDGVTLYPNPSSGQAVVEFTLISGANVTLEVYNMLGQVVYSTQNNLG
ncbi:MAG TPA: two-component regulator propeller domain-containing protein, partial [Bacteroidia bacterium]|nr:two-component regulator propeller domain-containing protein [Bacteroidia bacterium]